MVSEDSNHCGAVFAPIHRSGYLGDCVETLWCQMVSACHMLQTARKLLKVVPFCGLEWIFLEERNDDFEKVLAAAHHIAIQVFFVVIAASVSDNVADAKEVA
ncbi:MAG: hypothetical protein WHT28_05440 [Fimbriimonadales bacterium]